MHALHALPCMLFPAGGAGPALRPAAPEADLARRVFTHDYAQLLPAQVRQIEPDKCQYSEYDWHGAVRACVPEYDVRARGRKDGNARLPLLRILPGSYFAAAEMAADEAFVALKKATGRN